MTKVIDFEKWRRIVAATRSINKEMRRLFSSALKGHLNSRDTEDFETHVGYSAQELRKTIESRFTPEMTWENHGTYWEVDHIVPLSKSIIRSFEDPWLRIFWSVHNLQPLEVFENHFKSNSIPSYLRVSNMEDRDPPPNRWAGRIRDKYDFVRCHIWNKGKLPVAPYWQWAGVLSPAEEHRRFLWALDQYGIEWDARIMKFMVQAQALYASAVAASAYKVLDSLDGGAVGEFFRNLKLALRDFNNEQENTRKMA